MTMQKLGYYDLMNIAEQNSEQSERNASKLKLPSYKGSKNKKEDPKSKALSDNVRKFLAKKEEEKRRKAEEDRLKREKLMEMRSKDKKAKGRVNRMLKLTKSANKSAMADAVDSLNDSLVDQNDELQPDDDDYGYVSQASQEMHKKLLQQYRSIKKSVPLTPQKIQDLPVPQVKTLSGKREQDSTAPLQPKEKELKRKKPPPPPGLSYHDLLALANEKKYIPPVAVPILDIPERKAEKFEYGRPMTAKEKEEYMAEKSLKDRVEKQIENGTFQHKTKTSDEKSAKRSSKPTKSVPPKESSKKTSNPPRPHSPPNPPKAYSLSETGLADCRPKQTHNGCSQHKSVNQEERNKQFSKSLKPVPSKDMTKKAISASHSCQIPNSPKPHMQFNKDRQDRGSNQGENRAFPTKSNSQDDRNAAKVASKPSKSVPTKDLMKKPSHVLNSTHYLGNKQSAQIGSKIEKVDKETQQHKGYREDHGKKRRLEESMSQPKLKHRQIIESDEDYDSEMDDFIDDSECDPNNISDMIRKITGYDKSKYRPADEEDECMETSAYDQMREESRSLRIGIKEDLEDMRLEEEERKRKLMKQKQLSKKSKKSLQLN